MKAQKYSDHELASLFPILPLNEMLQLEDSVRAHGLQHPITLFEGKILDGRHRYEACLTSGVKPRFDTYRGDDPLNFVLSANLHRRHLDSAQRAMIAAKLETLKQGGDRKSAQINQNANLHFDRSKAADALSVSPRAVATASKILDESPKLAKRVANGEISLHAAEKKLEEKKANGDNKAKEIVVLDKTGYRIPTKLIDLWNRSPEVQEMLSALSRIKGKLQTAQEENDILFRGFNFSGSISYISQAFIGIQVAMPYAVCTACQGQVASSCVLCKGKGFISKFHFDTVVPEEIKIIRRKGAVKV